MVSVTMQRGKGGGLEGGREGGVFYLEILPNRLVNPDTQREGERDGAVNRESYHSQGKDEEGE